MSRAAEFIAREEGIKLEPYYDIAGYPTIGVGHKLSDDKWADLSKWESITHKEALEQFDEHLQSFEKEVRRIIMATLTDKQVVALTSLAFNIGVHGLRTSLLAKQINRGEYMFEIAREWVTWCKYTEHGVKKVSRGLSRRRMREVYLFFEDELA